jgi:hypothetical protein
MHHARHDALTFDLVKHQQTKSRAAAALFFRSDRAFKTFAPIMSVSHRRQQSQFLISYA